MRRSLKILTWVAGAGFTLFVAGVAAVIIAYFYVAPDLPSVDSLKDVHLQVPLRVYTRDGRLIAEFGEKRRIPLTYDQFPPQLIHAFLAAEDDRFFEHPGVDYQGIIRAVIHLALTGHKSQGGSTITMQVARNFFLTAEKTYTRKISEMFLALKIDRELSKQDILTLYLNKIYLGARSYGVGAAAEIYYGKKVDQLSLPEMAMIAGLPQAPSAANPLANPHRALERRAYVLGRMRALDYISEAEYRQAMQAPISASLHARPVEVDAPYVAELVRQQMVQRFGDSAYSAGYRVTTTLDSRLQPAAVHALRDALQAYDQRHGYRGPVRHVTLPDGAAEAVAANSGGAPASSDAAASADAPQSGIDAKVLDKLDQLLDGVPEVGRLKPGLVLAIGDRDCQVYRPGGDTVTVGWDGLSWARRYIDDNDEGPAPDQAGDVVKPGDIVYLAATGDGGWRLAEIPQVQGALVAMDPMDGAVVALSGGYDFDQSKFNRATQAERQPGSAIKPFIYSAALNDGFTAATLVNDAPVVFEDKALEGIWRPENYSGRFFGPTRLREALVHSRNLVSIRVLRDIGVGPAINYLTRFGFPRDRLPRNLSLALGSATVTPVELAGGFAVFANGGYRVNPYFIQRIEDESGQVLFQADPRVVCRDCPQVDENDADAQAAAGSEQAAAADPQTPAAEPAEGQPAAAPVKLAPRVITPQNAWIVSDMMRDVIRRGTGRRALALGRHDLSGKTGTANDFQDAWFGGFNADLVTTAWVGFDQVRSLGNGEEGAHAALPAWVDFMRVALDGVPDHELPQPPGLVTVKIDPKTGLLAGADDPDAIFETFRAGHLPAHSPNAGDKGKKKKSKGDDLF
jgi:penicillin-binding protein 1A